MGTQKHGTQHPTGGGYPVTSERDKRWEKLAQSEYICKDEGFQRQDIGEFLAFNILLPLQEGADSWVE